MMVFLDMDCKDEAILMGLVDCSKLVMAVYTVRLTRTTFIKTGTTASNRTDCGKP